MHCKINDAEDFTRQPELFTAFCEIDRLNLQSPMVFILSRRRPCHTGCLLISVACLGINNLVIFWSLRAEILKT